MTRITSAEPGFDPRFRAPRVEEPHTRGLWRRAVRVGRNTTIIRSGAVLLAGCAFGGLNSLDMPGTEGHGDGSYTITIELPDFFFIDK